MQITRNAAQFIGCSSKSGIKARLMLVAILLTVLPFYAQSQSDQERTLQDLIQRLNDVITDPDYIARRGVGYALFLTGPTSTSAVSVPIQAYTTAFPTYTLSSLDANSFCVRLATPPEETNLEPEVCHPFSAIASIWFIPETEALLQEMPETGNQPQTPDMGGLLARMAQLNEPRNSDPRAYTGYSLQFRHSIVGDAPGGLGVFYGVEFRGIGGWGIARLDVISPRQDHLCMRIVQASAPGEGIATNYCVPFSNIASVRLLRNQDFPPGPYTYPVDYPDVTEFIAAQQGGTLMIAQDQPEQAQAAADAGVDIQTWWQSGAGTPLALRLTVPIDASGQTITVVGSSSTGEADYVVTEVGDGYLCLAVRATYTPLSIGELCTTFDNLVQVEASASP